MVILGIIGLILFFVYLKNRMDEVSETNTNRYLTVKDKINFDVNLSNFKNNLDVLEKNVNGYSTKNAKNYKVLFDKIYSINLKKANSEISFKNLETLHLKINYLIENKKEISNPMNGYRAEDSYYEFLNKHLLEFNNIYFPFINKTNIKDYYISLNNLLNINNSEKIAEKIGIENSNMIYTILKNIDYLFLRNDISIEEKHTLEHILKTKITNI